MNKINITSHPEVERVFQAYPEEVRGKMAHLRRLVLETAAELDDVQHIEETLKWGEPSYLAKKGSTLRMDWKPKAPDQYAMYFKCTSALVPTFKMVFGDLFSYEGNRAIVFRMEEAVPEAELKRCIAAGLRYHRVKGLRLLGM